jgi:hypothetical protein
MNTLYLCSPPSIWSGIARILDFGSTFDTYNTTSTSEEADGIGLLSDWSMVGHDLWNSIHRFGNTGNTNIQLQSLEPTPARVSEPDLIAR